MLRNVLFMGSFLLLGVVYSASAEVGFVNMVGGEGKPDTTFVVKEGTDDSRFRGTFDVDEGNKDNSSSNYNLKEELENYEPLYTDEEIESALEELEGKVVEEEIEENNVTIRLEKPFEKMDVKIGQVLEVSLLEEDPQEWSFDKKFKTLNFVSANRVASRLIVTFEVVEMGNERVYFDYIDKSNGDFKVIESRILDITVGL